MNKSKKNQDIYEKSGYVIQVLPNANFRVRLSDQDHVILAHTAGRIRKRKIRIIAGDKVSIEMSKYDLNRGRIIYREKSDGSGNVRYNSNSNTSNNNSDGS